LKKTWGGKEGGVGKNLVREKKGGGVSLFCGTILGKNKAKDPDPTNSPRGGFGCPVRPDLSRVRSVIQRKSRNPFHLEPLAGVEKTNGVHLKAPNGRTGRSRKRG